MFEESISNLCELWEATSKAIEEKSNILPELIHADYNLKHRIVKPNKCKFTWEDSKSFGDLVINKSISFPFLIF